MPSRREALTAAHRRAETAIDEVESAAAGEFAQALGRAEVELSQHYEIEDRLLAGEPLFAKARAQHDDVRELAAEIRRSLEAGHASDVRHLTRRFCALARHNIIEEERDIFPCLKERLGADYDQ